MFDGCRESNEGHSHSWPAMDSPMKSPFQGASFYSDTCI